jgi:hypothetical protein
MRVFRARLGALGIAASLAIAACSGNLPQGGTGTGGAGATTGTGGSVISGTGGVSVVGRIPMLHRPTATVCSGQLAEAGVKMSVYDGGSSGPLAPDGGTITCATDSDCPPCTNGQLDHCFSHPQLLTGPSCGCDECNGDQDCGSTGVCACNQTGWSNIPVGNVCILAGNCRVDADCGPGGFCSPSPANCGVGGYYCHTAKDTCLDYADCPTACAYSLAAGDWACTTSACGGG